MYDHPFQWGSKRTGPDLARVGGRYSDAWHVDHLNDPQSVVPESIMPKYAFLSDTKIDGEHVEACCKRTALSACPTRTNRSKALCDFHAQADPDGDWDGLLERYPGAAVSNFDGQPELTEMDALIAYLQVLGTMVDFSTFTPDASR